MKKSRPVRATYDCDCPITHYLETCYAWAAPGYAPLCTECGREMVRRGSGDKVEPQMRLEIDTSIPDVILYNE